MSFKYTNSQNKEITVDFDLLEEFKDEKLSYKNISFSNDGKVRFKINNQIRKITKKNISREKFLKECEFPFFTYKGKKESLIFEISKLSEYINVINYYRLLDMLEKLIGISISDSDKHLSLVHTELRNLISPVPFLKNRKSILNGTFKYNINDLKDKVQKNANPKYLQEYLDVINNYENNPTDVFFRGVSTPIYPEQAGVFRIKNGEVEDEMFNEMVLRHPAHFKGYTTIEKLTDMQHFELKTRLLDITTNPLVALYMATNKIYTGDPDQKEYGEVIVYFADVDSVINMDSPYASYLANLARLSSEDKNDILNLINKFEKIGKTKEFIDLIVYSMDSLKKNSTIISINQKLKKLNEKEKDATYIDGLVALSNLISLVSGEINTFNKYVITELLKPKIVKVGFTNDRIRMQSGCFILSGLDGDYLNKVRTSDGDIVSSRIINRFPRIIIKNKREIFKELANYGIHDSTMLPDLQHSASYIIDKYR